MIACLDTSALVKLYVEEPGSADVRALVQAAAASATSVVAYTEARAALARRHRQGELAAADLRRAVKALDFDWNRLAVVGLDISLTRRAGELAEARALRGYDAIHLASALALRDRTTSAPLFACYDANLARAAQAEGLEVRGTAPEKA